MKQFVSYCRVSTQRQGQSGLGLQAQQNTIEQHIKSCGGSLVSEYVEIESGKNNGRPQLQAAIDQAKKTGSILIIAKLDRLSRNIAFIFSLQNAGIEFLACDLPTFNTLTLAIFAAMAQYEREVTSDRTKKALAAKKAQGFKLGKPSNLTLDAIRKGMTARIENARNRNKQASMIIKSLRNQGKTFRAIATELNDSGMRTINGHLYLPMSVKQIFDRTL